jgi:hypothetical protein
VQNKTHDFISRWKPMLRKLGTQSWGVILLSAIVAGSAGWLIARQGDHLSAPPAPAPTTTEVAAPTTSTSSQYILTQSEVATLAKRVSKGFVDTLNESGATGIRIAIENCYTRASELKTYKSAVYCFMLDNLYVFRDMHMSKRLGYKQAEFATPEVAQQRMFGALRNAGVPPENLEVQYESWMKLSMRDTAAYACGQFEARWSSDVSTLEELGCKSKFDNATMQATLDEYLDRSLREMESNATSSNEDADGGGDHSVASGEGAANGSQADCLGYGFRRGTSEFSACQLRLDEVRSRLELERQRYELQLRMYEQQMAAYNAQQKAIEQERERRRNEALLRFGLGMANSNSPTFAGGLQDGMAAMSGLPIKPPVAPEPPPMMQNYTVRMPNGNQVHCSYINNYISCR